MRIELIPAIAGLLVALGGIAVVLDGSLREGAFIARERRRRQRAERNRVGEFLIGLGVVGLGVALIGRDVWAYTTVAVLVAAPLLVAGALMNWRYLFELFAFRGALRRSADQDAAEPAPAASVASRPRPVTHATPVAPRTPPPSPPPPSPDVDPAAPHTRERRGTPRG
jgi:hypothetical protein